MADRPWWIEIDEARWTAATLDGERIRREPLALAEDGLPDVDALRVQLAELGWRGESLCLSLPSSWVLAGRISTADLPRNARRQAMIYRLEELLPVDAERLTVDFLPAVGDQALGLAVETEPVGRIVDRLAEAEVDVAAIAPADLLSLAACEEARDADFVVLPGQGRAEVFRLRDCRVTAWHTTAAGEERVAATIARLWQSVVDCRVVAAPSLEVIARNALAHPDRPTQVAVMLDAREGQIFGAVFERVGDDLKNVSAAAMRNVDGWVSELPARCHVLGDGVKRHQEKLETRGLVGLPEEYWYPDARQTLAIGSVRRRRGISASPRRSCRSICGRPSARRSMNSVGRRPASGGGSEA